MPFLAVGVEHRTAPLDVRERLALDTDGVARANTILAADPLIAEVAVLSTCNRTEVYLYSAAPEEAAAAVRAFLTGDDLSLRAYVQTWHEMDAVEHLFRVASGLESQIPGEAQIVSQVSGALELAEGGHSVGPNLHSLFRSAVACARQARAGTALGRVSSSVGSEAVRAAEAALGTLRGRSVLIIGGGEVSRLVANELQRHQLGTLYIANRTASVAVELAAQKRGTPARLSDIERLIGSVDVIFSATASSDFMITVEQVRGTISRHTDPLYIYDLALPRDIDPEVGEIPNVVLHDLSDLLPMGSDEAWSGDIRAIEAVISGEVQEFAAWYHTRRVAPVIASLRSHVEAVQQQELKRIAPHIKDLTERERAAVESMGRRLVDKMFHHLVLRLRLAAQTDPALVDAAEFFFLHGEGGLFDHAAESEQVAKLPR